MYFLKEKCSWFFFLRSKCQDYFPKLPSFTLQKPGKFQGQKIFKTTSLMRRARTITIYLSHLSERENQSEIFGTIQT